MHNVLPRVARYPVGIDLREVIDTQIGYLRACQYHSQHDGQRSPGIPLLSQEVMGSEDEGWSWQCSYSRPLSRRRGSAHNVLASKPPLDVPLRPACE